MVLLYSHTEQRCSFVSVAQVHHSTPQLRAAFQFVVASSRILLFLAISVVSLFLWVTHEALAVYRPGFAKKL